MPIKIEVKMDSESMAEFMIYHIYTGTSGILALVLGFLNVGFTISFVMRGNYLLAGVFLIFVAVILFLFPRFIKKSVTKQMENSKLTNPVIYEFDENGVRTKAEDDEEGKFLAWSGFKKAISRKRIVILYDTQKRAVILPIEQMGEHYAAVTDLIAAKMPASAVRIRRGDGKK